MTITNAFQMLPVSIRSSRQCLRLRQLPESACLSPRRNGSIRGLFGMDRCQRTSVVTLATRSIFSLSNANARESRDRERTITCRGTPKWAQFRWYATNRPQTNSQNDGASQSADSKFKKPKILSRLPIPTHENIYTIPNILTFSRLLAAPLIGYLLIHDYHGAALSLLGYAGFTDLIDGHIARHYNLQTVVGTIIDPMADKMLMTISVACLALNGSIPVWLAVVVLGRDAGLMVSAIYYRWISLPPPKTMARYWDFSLPSAEVRPTGISKVNTALQLLLVGSAMALPVIPEPITTAWSLREAMTGFQVWKTGLPVRSAVLKPHAGRLVVGWVTTSESRLLYLVATTTVWSGLSYVFSKNAVKILTKEEVNDRISRTLRKKQ